MPTSCRLFVFLAALLAFGPGVAAQESPDWTAKVDPRLLTELRKGDRADFLVVLTRQADLSAADQVVGKQNKGRFVYETLKAAALESQEPLLARFEELGIEYRPFWITNMVWVRGAQDLVEEIAARADVERIASNPRVELDRPQTSRDVLPLAVRSVEPNLDHTLAPQTFWANGFEGQGVVVGGQDTGYEWEHPALRSKYRGAKSGGVDHNYNWHDSIHTGGGACGPDSREPCDDSDHGTHTMGTMVGDDGGANQIGMAPGAKWIGCRNMDQGVGTPATYSECFEWFVAPTDLDGQNPDPAKAPDIINNSWSCPPSEGCTDPNVLRGVVENTRRAGILVVVSAGNEGPGCATVASPPAIYDASLTVGATNNNDGITNFSSRGPVNVDGSNRVKPDVVAPGFQVRSSVRGGGYRALNGTSMAGPHVAGLAALLISSGSCLRGDVDSLEAHILETTEPTTTSEFCGVSGDEVPNTIYGHGAVRAAMPSCGDGVTGSVAGVEMQKLTCRNRSARPKVKKTMKFDDGDHAVEWDCREAGVSASNNDKFKVQITATAVSAEAGGVVEGISEPKVVCQNKTAGGKKTIRPEDGAGWDCVAAGLEVHSGDTIKLTISGRAG